MNVGAWRACSPTVGMCRWMGYSPNAASLASAAEEWPLTRGNEGMNYWLMKSEPSVFGIDDLARAKNSTASWDGVRNFQARNYLREMKKGDLAFFYHSSCDVPGIAGVAAIQREAYPDATAFDS